MKLGQYNNWNPQTNTVNGVLKDSHIVANSLPLDYTDISSIENWNKYGPGLIGSATGFKDWKCLQREIKILANAIVINDFNTNWINLSSNEQLIVLDYILSSIPTAKFAATVTDANQRTQIAINFDLNNRRARGNWETGAGRIQIMRIYLFGKIGRSDAFEVFNDVVRDGLLELYEGGIEGSIEDGITGINDFLLARIGTVYATTGLATRTYSVIDGSGNTMTDVANALVGIASDGLY